MTGAVVLAAMAGFTWAANTVAVRWGMKRNDVDPYVGAMVTVALAAVMMTTTALIVDHRWLPIADLWAPVLLGIMLPGIVQGIFFKAINDLGASRTAVIVGTVPIISSLAALLVLDESWTVPLAVGTALTVFGGGLIAAGERSSSRIRVVGLACAVLTALGFAARDVITRSIFVDIDVTPFVAASISQWSGLVVLVIVNVVRSRTDLTGKVRNSLPVMLLPAAIQTAALGFIFTAFERGDVTVVAPINNATQTIGVVTLGAVILGRSEATARVVVALAAVVAGAVLVGTAA